MTRKFLLDLEPQELEKELTANGFDRYRAGQVIAWAYEKKVGDFAKFTNLPLALRNALAADFSLRSLTIEKKEVSRLDGTVRFTFRTHDGFRVPTVFLPSKDRNSVCISSQIGCTIGCRFCASGKVRFKRNLSRGELLEQIIDVEQDLGRKVGGVLFMGMGEPLMNLTNVTSALRAIVDFKELGLGRRHITVSTAGLVPAIRKLAEEHPGVRLALSLHAPDEAIRFKLIPPEKVSYAVKDILEAGLYYSRKNNTHLTIEYILVPGVNDSLQTAQKLVKLIKRSSKTSDEVRVNLIPCNETDVSRWASPEDESVQRFRNILVKNDVLALVRQAKGADIGAACGQLGV